MPAVFEAGKGIPSIQQDLQLLDIKICEIVYLWVIYWCINLMNLFNY
jgi:hypothetical protein